ncbi:MAG: sulfatase [Candidatus Cryptobacteroides sp.]
MKTKLTLMTVLSGMAYSLADAQTGSPNIVLIMTDQQRADLCGREGFPMEITPFVDSLATSNVWFNRAYTTMPASSPARCSMFTGRYPSATAVRTNHNLQDVRFGTDMVRVLKENGYRTALVGKNHAYLKPSDMDFWSAYGHWGKGKPKTDGERHTADFLTKDARGQWLEPSPIKLEEQQPVKIVDETLQWIDRQSKQDSPFFVWVSFPEPHNPFQICEPYYSMFAPEKIPAPATDRSALKYKDSQYQILASLEDESCPDLQRDLPRLRGNYMGMIRLIDDQIKRLVEGCKEKGLYDNTIFIVLSDHGDYCGEYGLIRKGAGLPDCLARIPMVWAGYGIENTGAGPRADFVSIADIFPTLCTAIGAEIPLGVQGRSLWPMLTGGDYPIAEFESIVVQRGYGGLEYPLDESLTFDSEGALTPGKVAHFDELNTWTQSGMSRMVRKGDWKLIMDSYGNGELYNLGKDRSEIRNLFGIKKYAKIQDELLREMLSWELRLQDPLPVPGRRYSFKRDKYNYHIENK